MSSRETIFYRPEYLEVQGHSNLKVIENENFKIIFCLKSEVAYSLPLGLFGSFQKKKRVISILDFRQFWDLTNSELLKAGITRVEVTHPSHIYKNFVSEEWLKEAGFSIMFEDINHHIPVSKFTLHKMEQRKLQTLKDSNFQTKIMEKNELPIIYSFLKECRAEKGLKINVSIKKLKQLTERFPNRYDLFAGYFNNEMACAAITLKVSSDVAYYFLPGTSSKHKKASPMVGLLDSIVNFYTDSAKYLDLGVSSLEGKPQTGLITFKERMGGIQSAKRRYFIKI